MIDTKNFDAVAVRTAVLEGVAQAAKATEDFLAKHGDRDACGFAWVNVYGVRSNSKLGKLLQELGFRKDYTGSLQMWNPSGSWTQCITAKEEGARAMANVLRDKLGLEQAYAGSRMD